MLDLKAKEYDKAMLALAALARSVSNADPENLQAISLLGRTHLLAGDHPFAIATFNRLILKAPQSAEVHLGLAQAQVGDKQLAPARDCPRKAIQLKPDYFAA